MGTWHLSVYVAVRFLACQFMSTVLRLAAKTTPVWARHGRSCLIDRGRHTIAMSTTQKVGLTSESWYIDYSANAACPLSSLRPSAPPPPPSNALQHCIPGLPAVTGGCPHYSGGRQPHDSSHGGWRGAIPQQVRSTRWTVCSPTVHPANLHAAQPAARCCGRGPELTYGRIAGRSQNL